MCGAGLTAVVADLTGSYKFAKEKGINSKDHTIIVNHIYQYNKRRGLFKEKLNKICQACLKQAPPINEEDPDVPYYKDWNWKNEFYTKFGTHYLSEEIYALVFSGRITIQTSSKSRTKKIAGGFKAGITQVVAKREC